MSQVTHDAADTGAAATAALRRLIVAGQQFARAVADHDGVSDSEAMVLAQLRLAGSLTSRELARRVSLTPSAMTSLIDRLETAGLAARCEQRIDRRKRLVALSDQGRAPYSTPPMTTTRARWAGRVRTWSRNWSESPTDSRHKPIFCAGSATHNQHRDVHSKRRPPPINDHVAVSSG